MNYLAMLNNYLKAAIRNFWRNPKISIINIVGLSIGFGLFLIIWSYVRYEKDFDKFHNHYENIWLLKQNVFFMDAPYASARVGGGFASILKERYPSITHTCRISSPVEAMAGIPAGTPDFLRAQDIAMVAEAELERDKKGNKQNAALN